MSILGEIMRYLLQSMSICHPSKVEKRKGQDWVRENSILKCASTSRRMCGVEFRPDYYDSTIGWLGFNMTHLLSQVHPCPSRATTTVCKSLPKTSCKGILTPDTSLANPPTRLGSWIFHIPVPYFAHPTPSESLQPKNTFMSWYCPSFIPCQHVFWWVWGPIYPFAHLLQSTKTRCSSRLSV